MAMEYAEPMSLGSPVGSLGATTPAHQTPHGCQYLPGYLMGDLSLNTSTKSEVWFCAGNLCTDVSSHAFSLVSPHMNRSLSVLGGHHNQSGSPVPSARTPKSLAPRSYSSPKPPPPVGNEGAPKEKVGAPPVSTLLDDNSFLERRHAHLLKDLNRTDPSLHSSRFVTGDRSPPRLGMTSRITKQPQSPPSPAQIDPFYTQGESIRADVQLDDTWVTVFGFLPTSASFILQRFSQYGTILSHHVAPEHGNWIHIHYESSLQAKKALSRNGKVMLDHVMIGVVPCIDIKLMSASDATIASVPGTSSYPQTPTTPLTTSTYPHTIRSLTAAYNSSVSDRQVVDHALTPQKSNGILTKAMDYLFG